MRAASASYIQSQLLAQYTRARERQASAATLERANYFHGQADAIGEAARIVFPDGTWSVEAAHAALNGEAAQ